MQSLYLARQQDAVHIEATKRHRNLLWFRCPGDGRALRYGATAPLSGRLTMLSRRIIPLLPRFTASLPVAMISRMKVSSLETSTVRELET